MSWLTTMAEAALLALFCLAFALFVGWASLAGIFHLAFGRHGFRER